VCNDGEGEGLAGGVSACIQSGLSQNLYGFPALSAFSAQDAAEFAGEPKKMARQQTQRQAGEMDRYPHG
jgi:hypothetical protein